MKTLEQLKEMNEAPEFLTEEGYRTLLGGYLLPNETPVGMYKRVSKAAADILKRPDLEQKFFDIIFKNYLCLSTPVAANFGVARALPISCYSQHLPDSTIGIGNKNTELMLLSKYGGGVGSYFGDLRPKGSEISGTGGYSDSIIKWAKIYDSSIAAVSQGSTRRGSAALYLPINHGDIQDFLSMRKPTGDMNTRCMNLHHAVTIPDEFMNRAKDGHRESRAMWEQLLELRVATGEPYMLFTDNVNNNNPLCYKDKGLKVVTSNLCLAGDTLVTTRSGIFPIKDLVGKTIEIFDGEKWVSNSKFRKTGEDKLYRIELSDGSHVDATANHKWKTINNEDFIPTSSLGYGSKIQNVGFVDGECVAKDWTTVLWIDDLPGIHDTYCTTVDSTHEFALGNGLMSGNCNEIMLHTDKDHTFVCCLSSLNLARFDEWKDTDTVELSIYFLDAVMEEFIQKASKIEGLESAVRFAVKSRALGLGTLGYHTALQQKNIPFDSFESMALNALMFRTIKAKAELATAKMAKEYGEPEWCKGHNRRHTHLLATAPTTSNSLISGGVSQGIEPIAANIYVQNSAKGSFVRKNKNLEVFLKANNLDTDEVWHQINKDAGSILNVKGLSEEDKKIFLTAKEINQHAIVKQASQRQQWIDQGQSVNLFFASNASPKYIHDVHWSAWEGGMKGLYYLRSESVLRADLASRSKDECEACSG